MEILGKFQRFVALTLLLGGLVLATALSLPLGDANATVAGCRPPITEYPHKSTANYWVDVHGRTDCTGASGVTSVGVQTALYQNGWIVATDYAGGYQYAVSTAIDYCPTSGQFWGSSSHPIVKNGVQYVLYSESQAWPTLSC